MTALDIILKRLARHLVAPSARIAEPYRRRQAQLLSGSLLGLIGLAVLIELTTIALIERANYTGYWQTLNAVLCLLVVYAISRTQHLDLAAILTVVVALAAAFITGMIQPFSVFGGLLDYLFLPLWLGSLFIGMRRLSLLIGATLLGLLLFPLAAPQISLNAILIGPFSFLTAASLLLLLATYYRNLLEDDRRGELQALVNQVQQTNTGLLQAYNSTIEGWSRVLDLRDKETEGHSQRVTELTVRMAQALGCDETELVHIRWGALLHDIGKMGVPDRILLKAGPLTDEEWALMRMHPAYAYEMLQPIQYLRPALDIPYCHHEKWDGSGYPRGLRGPQIPLAARIFSLADVWDALTSDRPYRPAWTPERARDYIREQSGIYFDPELVEPFLAMLNKASELQPVEIPR